MVRIERFVSAVNSKLFDSSYIIVTLAVPGFQEIMYPLLKLIGDGKEHNFRDVTETLASEFKLTDEARRELLQSGQQIFDDRVGRARTYMKDV